MSWQMAVTNICRRPGNGRNSREQAVRAKTYLVMIRACLLSYLFEAPEESIISLENIAQQSSHRHLENKWKKIAISAPSSGIHQCGNINAPDSIINYSPNSSARAKAILEAYVYAAACTRASCMPCARAMAAGWYSCAVT